MHETKSYFASDVRTFLATATRDIVGRLATRVGLEHSGNENAQIRSWQVQLDALKTALAQVGQTAETWGILVELPLLRLGRRIDTVVLIGDIILCVEFKIGASAFLTADEDQAVDYALCLRDFHAASHGRRIVPVLCSENASDEAAIMEVNFVDDVSGCLHINAGQLDLALESAAAISGPDQLDWREFDRAGYNPTPNIVEAARGVYAGHTVAEIGRTDANAEALARTSTRLQTIAEEAHTNRRKLVCFVTGTPGSGKTMIGLDLVFSGDLGRIAGSPAALLSGNRTLVHVLQEAIAADVRDRKGLKVGEARRRAQQALQTLLGYLKDHGDERSTPPENVIVFDEAQRAWDADTGFKLLGRQQSEPALFLEILDRLDWACLVCLVGPGQEINRGEGGLALWGEALSETRQNGRPWTAIAADEAVEKRGTLSGLYDLVDRDAFEIERDADLHLRVDLRAYRNIHYGRWVEELLAGNFDGAAAIAGEMDVPPAMLTRDLDDLRQWLKARQRGLQRVGLLASSGSVRLVADGIPPSPRSNELDAVAKWFLKPAGDYRSSNSLEVPLSEFVCQGLEIDYAGLCWGGDLIWREDKWAPRQMRAPRWQAIKNENGRRYRFNAYRVLLTRARAGLAIYVPRGNDNDPTRQQSEFDEIATGLETAGCLPLKRLDNGLV